MGVLFFFFAWLWCCLGCIQKKNVRTVYRNLIFMSIIFPGYTKKFLPETLDNYTDSHSPVARVANHAYFDACMVSTSTKYNPLNFYLLELLFCGNMKFPLQWSSKFRVAFYFVKSHTIYTCTTVILPLCAFSSSYSQSKLVMEMSISYGPKILA